MSFRGIISAVASMATRLANVAARVTGYGDPEEGGHWVVRFTNITHRDGRGRLPLHGRLRLFTRGNSSLRFSWDVPSSFAHARVGVEPMEGEACVELALPPFALWFAVESWPMFGGKGEGREVSIAAHDNSIWWRLWTSPDSWSSSTPRWREGNFDVARLLFGEQRVERRPMGEPFPVLVPMPEGPYPGVIKMEQIVISRPRWLTEISTVGEIKLQHPIPIPGKGENPWDIDDDVIRSASIQARNPGEVIGALVASATETRMSRGGRNWRPKTPPPMVVEA